MCYIAVMAQRLQNLPLFPLELVLFPGEQTALHLFEPRYKQLLEDVEISQGMFGIPYLESKNKMKYCSVVGLTSVTKRHPGGESDIIITGHEVGAMRSFYDPMPDKLYAGGTVEIIESISTELANEAVKEELALLKAIIGKKADKLDPEEYQFLHRIVTSLGLSNLQKLHFLKLEDDNARQRYVANLLRLSRLIVSQEQRIENGVFPN